jgi:hypothetical protein
MGWIDFGDLPRWVRVLDREAAGRLTEAGTIDWPEPASAGVGDGVERIDRFDDDATALWDRIYGGGAGTRRSAAFLNWRYTSHPTFQYRLFERRQGGTLRGLAVYRIEQVQDLARVGRITELVSDPDHIGSLLDGVADDARDNDVAMLDLFCSSPGLGAAMTANGFQAGDTPAARALPMLFQPIDRSRSGILFMAHVRKCVDTSSLEEWYVTSADGDQDRPN